MSENKFYNNKDIAYLKSLSREAVEVTSDTSVLFFQVDYEKSKRNFYGELIIKKWVNPLGVEVKGIIQLVEGGDLVVEDIPNKILTLNFSCYISHLRELNIDPQLGDFFTTKNRIYMIHNKSILDANQVSVATDKEALYCKFDCVQSDSEQLDPPGSMDGTPEGNKNDITGESQFNTGLPQI